MTSEQTETNTIDLPTVAAIAILVYALGSVLHEGLGHGGACLLVHGRPVRLTSATFDCDTHLLDDAARRTVAAGGTLINLVVGATALATFYRMRSTGPLRFTVWLIAAANVMLGFGYFFYSGFTGIGDWADVTSQFEPLYFWRVLMGAGGLALYIFATKRLYARLAALLPSADRVTIAKRVSLTAYLSGCMLMCVTGLFDPGGVIILAISSAAASLGGTSGFAWGWQTLRGMKNEPAPGARLAIHRDVTVIVVAFVVAVAFVLTFGRGVDLR